MEEETEYVNGVEVLAGLCDEHGLNHWDSEAMACDTHIFVDKAGNPHECWEAPSGMVNVVISMTPEQAVQLGETCQLEPWEVEPETGTYYDMRCGCGYAADVADWAEWRFCPNCGKRMVDE